MPHIKTKPMSEYYPPYSNSAECKGINLTISSAYTFENSVTTSRTICEEILIPYYQKTCLILNYSVSGRPPCFPSLNDGQGSCTGSSDYDGACFLTLNGQACRSCNYAYNASIYDCSNVDGGGTGVLDQLQVIPIISECLFGTISFNCTLCAGGNSLAYTYHDINVTIPGIGERSCSYLALAEYLALIPSASCPVVAEAAQKSCCTYRCDMCGPGAYIPVENDDIPLNLAVPGYEGFTCGDFASAAYVNFSIPKGTCALFAGLIHETCCKVRRDECSLCDGPLKNPDANVTIEGKSIQCANLQSFLTAQECGDELFSHVSPVCCSASVVSVPPLEPGSEEAETPAAATGILAKGGFLPSVGGVMFAAFLVIATC